MATVHGDKYVDPAVLTNNLFLKPKIRIPWWIFYPYKVVTLLIRVTLWTLHLVLWRFPYLSVPLLGLGYLYFTQGEWLAVSVVAFVVAGLSVWWWRARASFWRWIGWFYVAQWRRWWVYQRNWYTICTNLSLAMAFDGDRYFPRIVKVRRDGEGDLVTVRMLDGQLPETWGQYAPNFAKSFNANTCVVRPVVSRWFRLRNRIVLHLKVRDNLAKTVGPFTVPAVPDVGALPLAIGAGMRQVCIGIRWHVLIAGATGAGKGSVLWAFLAALAGGIRDGLVEVHAFDPKGGVELYPGRGLFHRFHYGTTQQMADALEELAADMKARQDRQRGHGRTHVATTAEPVKVILIDEFGALTAYLTDKKLKERIEAAVSLLLSQGRAVGFHVIAALQDPRKEILPFRNLFGVRIALRLSEKKEVALILDDDALDRGATCHLIPMSLPGIAFMLFEDNPIPEQIRFPYHADSDIEELAEAYAPAMTVPAEWVVNR